MTRKADRIVTQFARQVAAVRDLHRPIPHYEGDTVIDVCAGCSLLTRKATPPPWPCDTIRAIERVE